MNYNTKTDRFADVTEQEIEALLSSRDSSSTKSSTRMSVNCLREFCEQNKINFSEVDRMCKTELCDLLRKFYVSARTKTGELYQKNTLNCIKYGLARHFRSFSGIDIINDPEFTAANAAFKAQGIDLKRQGKATIQHFPEIEPKDLRKLYDSVAKEINTPRGLQRKVWLDVMFYLIRRGRENLRQMTKKTFAVGKDVSGLRFVHQVVGERDKNHRGENDDPEDTVGDGRIYEKPGINLGVESKLNNL